MTDGKGSVLVVDDKENMLALLSKVLCRYNDVTTASDGSKALALLADQEFDVVLTDIRMPGADGFEVIRAVKEKWPRTEVIMMTAYGSVASAVDAMKKGAYDYVQKPFNPDDVGLVVARALEQRRGRNERQVAGTDAATGVAPDDATAGLPYQVFVDRVRERSSRDYLVALLRRFSGNVTHAADQAGMERESLHRLLKRYDVRAEEFRAGSARDGKE